MPARTSAGKKSQVVVGEDPKQGQGTELAGRTPEVFFPFARYTSIAGVHTSLLVFAALFLPRTSLPSLINVAPFSSPDGGATAAQTPRDGLQLLTENPLRTVLWICVGSVILQGWWSNWLRSWSLESRAFARGEKDTGEQAVLKMKQTEWRNSWPAAFSKACLATFIASIASYIIIVLFGAPISSHVPQTYVLSLLISLLTVFTPAYILGLPVGPGTFVVRMNWIRLFAELSPRSPIERAFVYPAIGTVLGCWIGAIPIGLDWGRRWQAWPLTSAYGAVAGHVLGSLSALAVSALKEVMKTGNGQFQAL